MKKNRKTLELYLENCRKTLEKPYLKGPNTSLEVVGNWGGGGVFVAKTSGNGWFFDAFLMVLGTGFLGFFQGFYGGLWWISGGILAEVVSIVISMSVIFIIFGVYW